MKKAVSYVLTLAMLLSLCAMSAFAAPAPEPELAEPFQPQSFTVVTGDIVEHFYINENREVFVNGRNITTITQTVTPVYGGITPFADDDEWTFAMEVTLTYDLSGLSPIGVSNLLTKLGFSALTSTILDMSADLIIGEVFQNGVYLEDVQRTYYKNIHQSRPDMKIEHSFYLVAEVLGEVVLDE